jgi:predicted dinucleotide-binding enzyme
MKIAIIGHGNVGGALAQNWAGKGHEIIIGARNEEDEKVRKLTALERITATSIPEAAEAADVILIATPPNIITNLLESFDPAEEQVVIDATNSIRPWSRQYPTAFHALRDLTDAQVVKCFNTTGYENMLDPVYDGVGVDMFVAGSSEQGKAVATQLALDAGFGACYDFGGDDRVEALEKLAFAWINLAIFQGLGRNVAFKVLKR